VNDLKRMRLIGNVGYMKLTKYTYKDLVGKFEETRDLCAPTFRQKGPYRNRPCYCELGEVTNQ